VATALAENGHKQSSQGDVAIRTKKEDKYRALEEKMEGPDSPSGLGYRHYA
jgi:hypothetical protein